MVVVPILIALQQRHVCYELLVASLHAVAGADFGVGEEVVDPAVVALPSSSGGVEPLHPTASYVRCAAAAQSDRYISFWADRRMSEVVGQLLS